MSFTYIIYIFNLTHPFYKMSEIQLTTEIGTNHIYSCDTFNENDPQGNSSDFLRNAAKATYAAMTIVDPKAVW